VVPDRGVPHDPDVGASTGASVDLHWLPLGAGGWFVRLNGRVYEAIKATAEGRRRFDLYHSALEIQVPEGQGSERYVIEDAWPIPDGDGAARGVVVEGPVMSPLIARLRVFRYEIRRWRGGTIPDISYVVSTKRLSVDPTVAERVLALCPEVPGLVWGRDEAGIGDMWNSNSVIAWLLAGAGVPLDGAAPPPGGRAPGWRAGLVRAPGHAAT
jgi:hypothetical protein